MWQCGKRGREAVWRWDSGRLLGNLCGGTENGENGKYATDT